MKKYKKDDTGRTKTNIYNKAAIILLCHGASYCLDLSNTKSQICFKDRLYYLLEEFGVDCCKFDAGDSVFYDDYIVSFKSCTPNDHTTFFAELWLKYPLNEYLLRHHDNLCLSNEITAEFGKITVKGGSLLIFYSHD